MDDATARADAAVAGMRSGLNTLVAQYRRQQQQQLIGTSLPAAADGVLVAWLLRCTTDILLAVLQHAVIVRDHQRRRRVSALHVLAGMALQRHAQWHPLHRPALFGSTLRGGMAAASATDIQPLSLSSASSTLVLLTHPSVSLPHLLVQLHRLIATQAVTAVAHVLAPPQQRSAAHQRSHCAACAARGDENEASSRQRGDS